MPFLALAEQVIRRGFAVPHVGDLVGHARWAHYAVPRFNGEASGRRAAACGRYLVGEQIDKYVGVL